MNFKHKNLIKDQLKQNHLHHQLTGAAVIGGRHPALEADLAKGGIVYIDVLGAVNVCEATY